MDNLNNKQKKLEEKLQKTTKQNEELQKTADKLLIRQIKAKLDKLKRNEQEEQLQVEKYLEKGLQENDAKKLAELGEMIEISSERIKLLKEFPDSFEEKVKRLETATKTHDESFRKFNILLTEAQKRATEAKNEKTKENTKQKKAPEWGKKGKTKTPDKSTEEEGKKFEEQKKATISEAKEENKEQEKIQFLINELIESAKETKELGNKLNTLLDRRNALMNKIEAEKEKTTVEEVKTTPVDNETQEGINGDREKENKEKVEETLNLNDFNWESDYYYTPSGRFKFVYNEQYQEIAIIQINFEYKKRKYLNYFLGEKKVKLKTPKWTIDIDIGKNLGKVKLYDREKEVYYDTQEKALEEINKILEANSEIKKAVKSEKESKEKESLEIEKDKKENPFKYFLANRIRNKIFKNFFVDNDGNLDLRNVKEGGEEREFMHLQNTGNNEGCFNFNMFGFAKIIKNIEDLKTKKGEEISINAHSEKAVYKIIGPKGEIVADDIQGYKNANKVYREATEKYKKEVEEEFNKLNIQK